MRLVASILLITLLTVAAVVFLRSPMNFAWQDREHPAEGSSTLHVTGTDQMGRDRTVRVAVALLLSLFGAAAAAAIATTFALCLGLAAAFCSPWIARTITYLSDLFLAIPWLFLLMVVRAALPLNMAPTQSAIVTFLLLSVLGIPLFVRLNYACSMAVRDADWLIHARASGLRMSQIAVKHVVPHLRPFAVSQFLVYVPVCVLSEANLGTLGLGISQPLPSWGSMLQELSGSALLSQSHWMYLPAALLVLVLLLLEILAFEAKA